MSLLADTSTHMLSVCQPCHRQSHPLSWPGTPVLYPVVHLHVHVRTYCLSHPFDFWPFSLLKENSKAEYLLADKLSGFRGGSCGTCYCRGFKIWFLMLERSAFIIEYFMRLKAVYHNTCVNISVTLEIGRNRLVTRSHGWNWGYIVALKILSVGHAFNRKWWGCSVLSLDEQSLLWFV